MRSRLGTVSLVLTLACLLTPGVALSAPADRATCPASAKTVASKRIEVRGTYYGKAVIKLSADSGSYTVCAFTKVAKRFARSSNVVRQTLLHRAPDGDVLGRVRADTTADKKVPLAFSSTFGLGPQRYVFKVKVEAKRTASAQVTHRTDF